MTQEIKKEAEALKQELISLRRDFHQYPELGFKEFRTQKKVMVFLQDLGLDPDKIAETGVCTVLEGSAPGPTLMLRTDMDAVPVTEALDHPFRSTVPGVAHACGHDGHLAIMLGTAKLLKSRQSDLAGRIKFVFQPNEEEAGAYKLIEEGVMADVDACLGLHLWSQADSGTMDIDQGPIMAASHYFTLTIQGAGGHAGFSHEAVDPILVATHIIQSVQAIQTREVNALNPCVIMFTRIVSGTSPTIIPEQVEIQGSIRFLYKGGEELFDRFERIIRHTCAAHQVTYTLNFSVGNHLLNNDPGLTQLARSAALDTVGDPARVSRKVHTMAGEDFADYTRHAPGAFVFLGSRNPKKDCIYPHHHPKFDIDEDVLPLGVEWFARASLQYLSPSES